MFELFNLIEIKIDESSCLLQPPTRYVQSNKKAMKDLKNLAVSVDMHQFADVVRRQASWIKHLISSKAFADDAGLANIAFMIEVVKKAWYYGQVLNSEFSKFITIIKSTHFLRLFPYILACFRLMNVDNKEMIASDGFKPLAELCTVALNQSAIQCEVFVPTELLTLAETYYAMPEVDQKVYILDYIRTNKIFLQKEFWETYLLWSVLRKAKTQQHFERRSVNLNTLKQSAIDTVGSVFRCAILTMARAGLEKSAAEDIVMSMIDKFKLDHGNRSLALAFLDNYSLEKTTVPEAAKAKLMLSSYEQG